VISATSPDRKNSPGSKQYSSRLIIKIKKERAKTVQKNLWGMMTSTTPDANTG